MQKFLLSDCPKAFAVCLFILGSHALAESKSVSNSAGSVSSSASNNDNSVGKSKDANGGSGPKITNALEKIQTAVANNQCMGGGELGSLFSADQQSADPQLSFMQYDDGFVASVRDTENNTISVQICHQ